MSILNTPVFERDAILSGDGDHTAALSGRLPGQSGAAARPSVTDEPPRIVRGVFYGLLLAGAGWALIAGGVAYAFG